MKLQVVMLDTWGTYCALTHEQQLIPYGRRLVSIELTPEQVAQLQPRSVGVSQGAPVLETVGDVWLESPTPAQAEVGK